MSTLFPLPPQIQTSGLSAAATAVPATAVDASSNTLPAASDPAVGGNFGFGQVLASTSAQSALGKPSFDQRGVAPSLSNDATAPSSVRNGKSRRDDVAGSASGSLLFEASQYAAERDSGSESGVSESKRISSVAAGRITQDGELIVPGDLNAMKRSDVVLSSKAANSDERWPNGIGENGEDGAGSSQALFSMPPSKEGTRGTQSVSTDVRTKQLSDSASGNIDACGSVNGQTERSAVVVDAQVLSGAGSATTQYENGNGTTPILCVRSQSRTKSGSSGAHRDSESGDVKFSGPRLPVANGESNVDALVCDTLGGVGAQVVAYVSVPQTGNAMAAENDGNPAAENMEEAESSSTVLGSPNRATPMALVGTGVGGVPVDRNPEQPSPKTAKTETVRSSAEAAPVKVKSADDSAGVDTNLSARNNTAQGRVFTETRLLHVSSGGTKASANAVILPAEEATVSEGRNLGVATVQNSVASTASQDNSLSVGAGTQPRITGAAQTDIKASSSESWFSSPASKALLLHANITTQPVSQYSAAQGNDDLSLAVSAPQSMQAAQQSIESGIAGIPGDVAWADQAVMATFELPRVRVRSAGGDGVTYGTDTQSDELPDLPAGSSLDVLSSRGVPRDVLFPLLEKAGFSLSVNCGDTKVAKTPGAKEERTQGTVALVTPVSGAQPSSGPREPQNLSSTAERVKALQSAGSAEGVLGDATKMAPQPAIDMDTDGRGLGHAVQIGNQVSARDVRGTETILSQQERQPSYPGEIIADGVGKSVQTLQKTGGLLEENSFKERSISALRKNDAAIGTSSAQFGTVMQSESHSSLVPMLAPQVREVAGSSLGMNTDFVVRNSEDSFPQQTASRTLSVVRNVIEHVRGSGRRAVELSLRLPEGSTLSLYIQMRGGVAHTTFRTDSAELREALAQGWQNTMPAVLSGDAPVKLAEPSFILGASAQDSEHSELNSDGSRQQQQGQQFDMSGEFSRSSRQQNSASSGIASGRGVFTSESDETQSENGPQVLRPETSRHLHTFA